MDALSPDFEIRAIDGSCRPEGAIWAMPYPAEYEPRSPNVSAATKNGMRALIHGYIRAMMPKLSLGAGVGVCVILLDKQHLDWGPRQDVLTVAGVAKPEMRVFSLQPLVDMGYRPRFGDSRDQLKKAHFHVLGESVCIQWRVQASPGPTLGMTDTRLRDGMASSGRI